MAQQIIGLGTIPNDGTGEDLRSGGDKINDNFTEVYGVGGWAQYADDLTIPSIVIGTAYTQITLNKLGASTDEAYLPREIRGSGTLFASNKITPIGVGDFYHGRLDITVSAKTGSPTLIEVIVDISGSTPGTNKIYTGYIQTGGSIPYDQTLNFKFFSKATFLANGGSIYVRTDTGTITITKRNILIERTFKDI